jgi:hypothetical protein
MGIRDLKRWPGPRSVATPESSMTNHEKAISKMIAEAERLRRQALEGRVPAARRRTTDRPWEDLDDDTLWPRLRRLLRHIVLGVLGTPEAQRSVGAAAAVPPLPKAPASPTVRPARREGSRGRPPRAPSTDARESAQ